MNLIYLFINNEARSLGVREEVFFFFFFRNIGYMLERRPTSPSN